MEGNNFAIGIDLGTTNSCVGVLRNGKVDIIANDSGSRTTPSVVAFTDTERYIGDSAKTHAHENPANTVFGVKRLMGRKFDDPEMKKITEMWPFSVVKDDDKPKVMVNFKNEEKYFTPEEISAMILANVKATADAFLEKDVKDAVITVPAYFNDAQRKATMDAGKIAGLNVLRIINEPTAAALAYGYAKNITEARNVLVFDLGGGTFDVSIVTIQNGTFRVRAVGGDTRLGGEDIDNTLLKHLASEYKRKNKINMEENKKALLRLKIACESAKKDLSQKPMTKLSVDALIDGKDYAVDLTRARLEDLTKEVFEKTLKAVEKALEDAKMTKTDIHDVVLVGGSTRIPKIRSCLQGFFDGKTLSQGVNPDEAVAYGAAIFANMLQENKGDIVEELQLKLIDVTPLSLGIETEGGFSEPLIARNTPIPTKCTKIFPTCKDNQISVKINVYEGERQMFKDNHFLGEFVVKGLPAAPKGFAKLDVTFEIDANGSLTVTAIDASGGNAASKITISKDQGQLSEQDISRMIEDAIKYKAEDEKQKARALCKTNLEDYISNIECQIEYNFKTKIAEVDKKAIFDHCTKITDWIDDKPHEVDEYNNKQKELEQIWFPIITKLLK